MGHAMDSVELTPATIRFSAMNFLAMREHSISELTLKLQQKFNNTELFKSKEFSSCFECIAAVIQKLAEEGLQSDIRFTEAFIIMRQRQGKGPLIIRLELKERGISNDSITKYINTSDETWNQLAVKVYIKKFGDQAALDIKQRSKQIRFLTARGFSLANIQSALKYIEEKE